MGLTREYFERKFGELDQKFITKEYFEGHLKEQLGLTKKYIDRKFDELGNKFVSKEYFEQKFENVATKVDLSAMEFRIGEKFAAKDDLLELATKSDLKRLEDKIDDISLKVTRIDIRTDEDIRAAYKDIAKLKSRSR